MRLRPRSPLAFWAAIAAFAALLGACPAVDGSGPPAAPPPAAPAPAQAPAPAPADNLVFAPPVVSGPLSAEVVADAFAKQRSGVAYCFDRVRRERGSLTGEVQLALKVDADGAVTGEVLSDTIGDEVGGCAALRLSRAKLPASRGETTVQQRLVAQ